MQRRRPRTAEVSPKAAAMQPYSYLRRRGSTLKGIHRAALYHVRSECSRRAAVPALTPPAAPSSICSRPPASRARSQLLHLPPLYHHVTTIPHSTVKVGFLLFSLGRFFMPRPWPTARPISSYFILLYPIIRLAFFLYNVAFRSVVKGYL